MEGNRTMEIAPLGTKMPSTLPKGTAYYVTTSDNKRIRVGVWKVAENKLGTICLFPGRAEYIELMEPMITDFLTEGFSVIILDWRGQGLSERLTHDTMLGHVGDFGEYQFDVDALISLAGQLKLPRPRFMVSHSMGGCIGLRAINRGLKFNASAFLAPMWGIHLPQWQSMIAGPVAKGLCGLRLGQLYAPGHNSTPVIKRTPFEKNPFTTDRISFEYWLNQCKTLPNRQIGGPSISWLHAALKETAELKSSTSPSIPADIFLGDNDTTVSASEIQRRSEFWNRSKLHILKGARHDLPMESPKFRRQILTTITTNFAKLA